MKEEAFYDMGRKLAAVFLVLISARPLSTKTAQSIVENLRVLHANKMGRKT